MATIDPGTGGTFKSNTVEALIHEICAFLQINEFNIDKNPNRFDNVVGTHSQNQNRYSCSYSLPLIQSTNSAGNVEYVATEYLSNLSFAPATGSTLKSTTVAGLLFEALIYAQNIEANPDKRMEGQDNITGRIDTDRKVFAGTIDMPVVLSVTAEGHIIYTATPFLLD